MASEPVAQHALPDPAVPSDAYDEDYYRHLCLGSDTWENSDGRQIHPIYHRFVELAGVGAGQTLVDIGCGRGELLVAAVAAGADRAIGVEYASAAMELANNTIHRHGLADRCRLVHADARQLPLPDNSAEHVTMLDVVEHLTVEELRLALAEARRILVPGGQLFIHTMPNRLIFSVTYRLQRLVVPWRLAKWPADPRMGHERIMHVNEQTVRTLRRAVRGAGFNSVRVWLGAWVRDDFQPAPRFARLYRGLARVPGLAQFGIADLFATARCP